MAMDTKQCARCARHLPLDSFYRDRKRKDGRQIYCAPCKNARQRDWYMRNQPTQAAKKNQQRNVRRLDARRRLYALLQQSSCADCGEQDPACLDFDHVRGQKRMSVTEMIGFCYGWDAIEREIAKCDVRCANCHRKKTAREQGWYASVIETADRLGGDTTVVTGAR